MEAESRYCPLFPQSRGAIERAPNRHHGLNSKTLLIGAEVNGCAINTRSLQEVGSLKVLSIEVEKVVPLVSVDGPAATSSAKKAKDAIGW